MGKRSLDFLGEPSRHEGDRAGPRRERKRVTVLFCDLAGFTARSEQIDPEDVQALLESYFSRVRQQVERFGGTLEKFIGDAVMAVFGAPVAHEDDPERAVRAALAIRDTFAGELELRIAVHTGEALVTLDADPDTGQGIVVGDVVNTASRLQGAAPLGGVIVGDATYRATEHAIDYHRLEPVVARGKRDPVPVWEARGERIDPAGRGLGAALVGRRRELDQLADALSRAQAERSVQLATILGVPGIGKTRLVRELYERVEGDGGAVVWLQGRSLPYGEGVTFWALGEIVKERAGIFEGDSPEAVEEKLQSLTENTLEAGEESRWVLRHLRPLVGLGGEGIGRTDSSDESFAAWRTFLEGLAEEAPLVVVLEDLHWADEGLLDFVDELVERAIDVAMLVVCTSRPELVDRRPAWGGGKRNVTTISLPPLSEDETALLMDALLAGTALRPAASGNLAARAGGNPLYAEEYARLVLARGTEDDIAIPDSLQALIAARLDGLSQEEKALLQDAAVVGETVWVGAVAAVGGRERPSVEELVRPLERKEFLMRHRRVAVEGESEYSFRHVLVRDVAYAQIPRAERGRKHRLAAAWIESLGRREDHAELLAHHYLRALDLAPASEGLDELTQRARRALTDAGERATALGALHAAARYFGAALDLLPEDDPERPRLMLRQGSALLFADIAGEDVLLAASEESAAGGDRLTAASAESLLGTLYQEQARGEEARARVTKAFELVEGLDTSPEKGKVLAEVARSRMMAGEDEEAVRVGSSVLEIADELDLAELRAHALCSLGPSRAHLGDIDGAIHDLERAIEIASSINSLQAARGYGNLRQVLSDAGELSRADEVRAEGQRLTERLGLRYYERQLRFDELEGLYFLGLNWDEVLSRADDLAEERSFNATTVFEVRARVRLARGDRDGAASDAVRALALARASLDPQVLLPALALASLVDVSIGRDAESALRIDELLPLVHTFGAPSTAFLLPALAVVLDRVGRSDELAELGERRAPTAWWEAASAYVAGDFDRAVEIYARIGSRPDEAYARLRAAERLVSEGREREAADQLEAALAFFRSVGATAYIREAEAVLAAST